MTERRRDAPRETPARSPEEQAERFHAELAELLAAVSARRTMRLVEDARRRGGKVA